LYCWLISSNQDFRNRGPTHERKGITVANTTEHPSRLFGTAGRALSLLEEEGVSTRGFLQLIIDKPEFRAQIIKAWRQMNPTVLHGIPDEPQNLDLLLKHVFGIRVITEEEVRADHKRYLSDWPDRLQEMLNDNEENVAELERLMEFYNSHENFVCLFDGLDERSISIVVMMYGLADGKSRTRKSTAEAHGTSPQSVYNALNRAFEQVRHNHDKAARQERLSPEYILSAAIEDLELSERARNPLRRTQINRVGDLVSKSEDDLLNITNFGEKSLAEVKAKLAERGLSLKQ
jgi:hypothetical protein